MSRTSVFSRGIYHGLPEFPEHENKGYTALIAGANGITGSYIIRALVEAPSRWKKIYALSRRAPRVDLGAKVEHVTVDLMQDPQAIADKLMAKDVVCDFLFFAAYVQPPPKPNEGVWSYTEETERVNVLLLKNLLEAISRSQSPPPQRVLQTGGKHYGVHLGPTLTPMEETDPRFTAQPNFYFPQEDLLFEWCERHKVGWNVTRPGFIVGAVHEAAMNVVQGLALYASVQRELGGKLEFPGNIGAWEAEKHFSSAALIGYHAEWAVLTAEARNQVLNIADDSMFSYGKFWPVLAGWYGLEYGTPSEGETAYQTVDMPVSPPPRGFGPAGRLRVAWSFEGWAQRAEVKEAWAALKARHGLVPSDMRDPFKNAKDFLGIVDAAVLGPWLSVMSVGRSRKLGWHGYVDTHEAMARTVDDLAKLKMVPPLPPVSGGNKELKYRGY